MIKYNTTVTYIDYLDLFQASRGKEVNSINFADIKDRDMVRLSEVLIFRHGNEYKVIKSKY